MLNVKRLSIVLMGLVLLVAGVAMTTETAAADSKIDIQGLVYIDDNLNGVWDVGEEGYGGDWQWVESEEVNRYVGATLTVTTPAYDEFTVESSPYREAGEDEVSMCTYQDLLVDDEINPNPVRPCFGTWGFPRLPIDMWVTVELTAPEGYYITSDSTQTILTGTDTGWIDFGIAPITAAE